MVDSRAESPENAVVADRGITNPGSSDEHAALGTAAARRFFREGISGAEVGDPLTSAFARSAIAELARLQREEAPGSYREALEGAEASAEQFNIDPLQGVSEVVQNADDLGATTVRVALSGPAGVRDELLIVHDGSPVRLVDALSMVLPYLSTKRSSARAKGRFGIGLKTLVKLGARVSVHSAPYDFEIEANSITPAGSAAGLPAFTAAPRVRPCLRSHLAKDSTKRPSTSGSRTGIPLPCFSSTRCGVSCCSTFSARQARSITGLRKRLFVISRPQSGTRGSMSSR